MQLAGELTNISLPSLIQLIRNGELTGKVCLSHGATTAFIFVDGGRIVHVESDLASGREALLELFVWLNGTFSFIETEIDDVPRTLPAEEPIEKIMREGVAYQEDKKYLDRLRITPRTVLKATAPLPDEPGLKFIDGRRQIGDILHASGVAQRLFCHSLKQVLVLGKVQVVEVPSDDGVVNLPAWVISRLKQDNPDLSQAIVEMVIWVDRVKCWMYQADAELEAVVGELSGRAISTESADGDAQHSDHEPPADVAPQAVSKRRPPQIEF